MGNFRVGQKVVCIKGAELPEASLIKGQIYTCAGYETDIKMYIKELPAKDRPFFVAYETRFKPLQLDHEFVEEIIKQVTPKKQTV